MYKEKARERRQLFINLLGGWQYDYYFGKTRQYVIGNNKSGAWCEIVGNIYENPELLEQPKPKETKLEGKSEGKL